MNNLVVKGWLNLSLSTFFSLFLAEPCNRVNVISGVKVADRRTKEEAKEGKTRSL